MGLPVRFTGPAAVVSWSRTPRESERESGAERVTVVGGGVAAKTVSAAARTRTVSRLLRSAPTRAWRWPVPERSGAEARGTRGGAGRRGGDRRAAGGGGRAGGGRPPAVGRAPGPAGSAGSPRRGAASS